MENQLAEDEKEERHTGDGSVDIKGNPVLKQNTGKWGACLFILGTECCERLAYYGIATNLVSYITGKLHESNVSAATSVTTWIDTCYITPLIGALSADAYLGRYGTIAIFSTIYFIGMCTSTLSAAVSALMPAECVGSVCPSATTAQYAVFFVGLYMIALGTGGIKPCVSSFGADQFDDSDSIEKVKKGAFFNWYFFSNQRRRSCFKHLHCLDPGKCWLGLGFWNSCSVYGDCYRQLLLQNALVQISETWWKPNHKNLSGFGSALRKRKLEVPGDDSFLYKSSGKDSAIEGSRKLEHTDELKCLDKAAVVSDDDINSSGISNPWRVCTVTQVEELKLLIRMLPIWVTGIVYKTVYVQIFTMFVEQESLSQLPGS